ncbi:MAG: hypothetical protein GX234_06430 [Clostridiales bacterium]|nr:hypothetical protein [Clostridiales bacterium]
MRNAQRANNLKIDSRKKEYGLLFLLIAGAALVYLSLCFNNNIWTDEAFTIDLLRSCDSYSEAVWFTAGDVHPPLYYLILKPFTDLFGLHLFLLKALSIVPMLFTMALGMTFVYRRFDFKTAFLYILMVFSIPCAMEYAVQVRMYSWAMFFVTACGFAAVDAWERGKKRDWVILALSGVAAAYTHYFAFIAVIWIYGFLFLALFFTARKKLGLWLGSVLVSLCAYFPWMRILRAQVSGVSQNYWISAIDMEVLLSYPGTLFKTKLPYSTVIMVVLFGAAFVWLVCDLWKDRKQKTERFYLHAAALLAVCVPVFTAATGVAVSLLMRPIFIARYLMPCVALFSFFFAVAWARAEKRVYAALLVFLFLLGTVVYEENWQMEYRSTHVPQTEAFFAEHLGENDLIVYNYKIFDFIYQYYFDADKLCYVEDVDLSGDYDNIWYLDTHYNPDFSENQLAEYGWKKTFVGNYGIEHDEFKIYRISKNE